MSDKLNTPNKKKNFEIEMVEWVERYEKSIRIEVYNSVISDMKDFIQQFKQQIRTYLIKVENYEQSIRDEKKSFDFDDWLDTSSKEMLDIKK